MFIHWGLYSIPAGIWKGEKMEDGGEGPTVAEWVMRRKEIPRSEYETLAEQFNPMKFDADSWVAIAKAAGMKYMIITAKHHDGFAMYDSAVDDFNIVKATPFKRDVIRELHSACKREGIAFGVYYSHSLDWRAGGDGGMKKYGPVSNPLLPSFPNYFDPAKASFDSYIENKSLKQVKEILKNYDNLCEIWFDTPLYIPPKYSMTFYKTVFDHQSTTLVTQRVGNDFGDIGTPGDNVIPEQADTSCWEGIATTNNSWGYNCYDEDWKSPQELLYWLVATCSKGGNFLLNVGPTSKGNIPRESVKSLMEVGNWLKINANAIYDSKPWKISHEGPSKLNINGTEDRQENGFSKFATSQDFWFTAKSEFIYAIAFIFPENHQITIKSLKGLKIRSIKLLGSETSTVWNYSPDGVECHIPELEKHPLGYVLEIETYVQ
jgi:alpha-L-fucosidase